MERLVELAMRGETRSDLVDRVVLGVGIMSLCLALAGTILMPRHGVTVEVETTQVTDAA